MRYTQTMLAKCLRQFLLKIVSKIIKNHFENIPHQQQRISSCKIKSSQIGHITPISNRPIKIKENRLHFQKPVVNRLPARPVFPTSLGCATTTKTTTMDDSKATEVAFHTPPFPHLFGLVQKPAKEIAFGTFLSTIECNY